MKGNAICRPSQLDLTYATTKINNASRREFFTAGLYAPTIRYHDGTFYIVCTTLTGRPDMPTDEDLAPQNFIITSIDLHDLNSFSNLVYFDFHGIDPSLLFDDDGKVYMQGSWIYGYRKKPATVIRQAEIDVSTGEYKSELKDIWTGSGDKVPEGPHLYKKDGKYWLLIAEGGTHRGHKITMARSDNVWGPYESYEKNPIITTQGVSHPIQCVGHGELFTDTNGEWWCSMLARREYGDAYPLGRETYLVPATWPENQFPSFDPVELEQVVNLSGRRLPDGHLLGGTNPVPKTVSVNSPHTLFLRTPDLGNISEDSSNARLTLKATSVELGSGTGSPTFIGRRQVALGSEASVILDLTDLPGGHCGLSVYKDTYHHISLDVNASKELTLAIAHHSQELGYTESRSIEKATSVKLIITSTIQRYLFSYDLLQEGSWQGEVAIGTVPASDMSGDDFTGKCYEMTILDARQRYGF